jgi:hypothetical protein
MSFSNIYAKTYAPFPGMRYANAYISNPIYAKADK